MKKIFFTGLMILILAACHKETDTMDRGTITGADPRDCMCCGGWFVEIRDTLHRFDLVPDGCTIDLNTATYPLKVKLDWKKKEQLCLGDEIVVSKMILE